MRSKEDIVLKRVTVSSGGRFYNVECDYVKTAGKVRMDIKRMYKGIKPGDAQILCDSLYRISLERLHTPTGSMVMTYDLFNTIDKRSSNFKQVIRILAFFDTRAFKQ